MTWWDTAQQVDMMWRDETAESVLLCLWFYHVVVFFISFFRLLFQFLLNFIVSRFHMNKLRFSLSQFCRMILKRMNWNLLVWSVWVQTGHQSSGCGPVLVWVSWSPSDCCCCSDVRYLSLRSWWCVCLLLLLTGHHYGNKEFGGKLRAKSLTQPLHRPPLVNSCILLLWFVVHVTVCVYYQFPNYFYLNI